MYTCVARARSYSIAPVVIGISTATLQGMPLTHSILFAVDAALHTDRILNTAF